MEKVVLLVEQSGAQIRCLLNPEQLEMKRCAGVASRRSASGTLAGIGLSDDPLLYRGGGTTELTLDLLFDIQLAQQGPDTPPVEDVRDLTRPVWDLAENRPSRSGYGRPPTVRLLWGPNWNLRGVVAAVSERLEHFDAQGRAGRSWLRLQLLRLNAPTVAESTEPVEPPMNKEEARRRLKVAPSAAHDPVGGNQGERLDQIAAERLGHPGLWSLLAELNGVVDPLRHGSSRFQVPAEPLIRADMAVADSVTPDGGGQ